MQAELSPLQALKKYYGYDSFRPGQENIINAVLASKDCLVIMPTGGGKSICFQIPALLMEGTMIVVSPLIALMQDQVDGLKAAGIAATYINSTLDGRETNTRIARLQQGEYKLLYLSPERLQTRAMYNILQHINISGFAIDEAHCISVWGHDFREEYSKLWFLKKKWPDKPLIALTATADKIARRDITQLLKLNEPVMHLGSFNRPNLSLQVLPGQKVYQQILKIMARHHGESGIIYCLSRAGCEEVAGKLNKDGYAAAHYHAGMSSEARAKVQDNFIKDNTPIIVATIAFGMGIDKSNIRFVIHYNLPKNIEGYYQEIGRGGRDGLPCETVMFYSFRDVMILQEFAQKSKLAEIQLAKLKRIQQYAEASVCRRKMLMTYFGEDLQEDCGNCDVCLHPPVVEDATITAQKALSAVLRLKEKIGIGTLIDVLRGSQKSYIFQRGYHEIKTFGAGQDLSVSDWQHYILQLLHHGLIEIAYDEHHVLKVTPAGHQVLFENRKVQAVKPEVSGTIKSPYLRREPKLSKKQSFELQLFDTLSALRKLIADSKGVPPYVIFSDSTLQEMAQQRPINTIEMAEISGVGQFKLDQYGETFIKEIQKAMVESDFSGGVIKGKTYLQTFKYLQAGKSVPEIAKMRKIHETTVYSHIGRLVEKKLIIDISPYITTDELTQVQKAVQETRERKSLNPLHTFLKGKISYGKIRIALSYINMQDE